MNMPRGSARSEWAGYWFLPLVGMFGYASAAIYTYSLGAFIQPLQAEFGWSRAFILSGLTIVNISSALTAMFLGALVDRLGPRPIALIGVPLMGATLMLLALATGGQGNWWALWVAVALGNLGTQGSVWTCAVVSRFDAGRGLALAVTLSGGSIGAFLFPVLSTSLIGALGWRYAFIALGALWVALLWPLLFFFFRGAQDGGRAAKAESAAVREGLSGMTLGEALRQPAFLKLVFASAAFAFCLLGTVVNFVPILKDMGVSPLAAAGTASLIGIFGLIGRLTTGAVLDRFPGHLVGAVSFLLPVPGIALLLIDSGAIGHYAAASLIGLTIGAEVDVISYLATRRFGLRNFGAIQGGFLAGLVNGPLSALGMMLISSLVISTVGKGKNYATH